MSVNQATVDLIKKWEGFKAKAYFDTIANPPIWTIGYGTTARAGVGIEPRAGMVITEQEAAGYLKKTIDKFAQTIRPNIKRPINENEFGAFVSLAYNIGPSAFAKSSALRLFNEGKRQEAADAILMWNKAGGKVVKGLVNRRNEERTFFLSPVIKPSVTPPKTSILTSILDWLKQFFKNP